MIEIRGTYKLLLAALGVLCMTFLFSFSQSDEVKVRNDSDSAISPLVQQKLQEKLDKFKKTILEKCKREAIQEAEIFVDSLVSEELMLQENNKTSFPAKPIRPGLPHKIILNDSTKIDPIIKEQ
ncbi:MAG: hypothetical protein ACI9P5_001050 [Saprospiraceae bacterium]|jgi:hypothetical protein|tara:strand:- start:1543 stop:1914 length:372 start_codon:yes stop_codon:yes gene_type:complete